MGSYYSAIYQSLPCVSLNETKTEGSNEMVTENQSQKNLHDQTRTLTSNVSTTGVVDVPVKVEKVKSRRRPSFNFSKENFLYLKRKDILKEYEFYERVGQGSFGLVYRAKDRITKEIRAVKAVSIKDLSETDFENEVDILKKVDHANIIKLHDVFLDNNFVYLIEEYCKGGDLFDYIKIQRYFTEKKAVSIMSQLLSAINHLHMKKIVHRDLKPDNIVFVESKSNEIVIKLIDFGTSIMKGKNPLTQELGTIYYIAPEVFKGNYDEKCDVWSLGIILYIMLCGNPPFKGVKDKEIKNKILKGDYNFNQKEWKNVSPEAIDLIKKLLTYDKDSRISCAEALEHPWIKKFQDKNTKDNFLKTNIIQNLILFHNSVLLAKAVISFISNNCDDTEDMRKIKAEFDKIDTNKDGYLSESELFQTLISVYPANECDLRIKDILNEVDFNRDGYISFSEFTTLTLKHDRNLSEETLRKAFNLFDIDGNGFITVWELKEILPFASVEEGDEEGKSQNIWEETIAEVDEDGDGQVSFEEFKKMMDIFSRSASNGDEEKGQNNPNNSPNATAETAITATNNTTK